MVATDWCGESDHVWFGEWDSFDAKLNHRKTKNILASTLKYAWLDDRSDYGNLFLKEGRKTNY